MHSIAAGPASGWGKRKKHFYGGNPDDFRQKKKVEDASDSELSEAAMEAVESAKLQAKQLEAMDEEDFLGAFAVEHDKKVQIDISCRIVW